MPQLELLHGPSALALDVYNGVRPSSQAAAQSLVFLSMGNTMENSMKIASTITAAALMIAVTPALAEVTVNNQAINETEVLAAQQGWCQALVDISTTNAKSGREAASALAEEVIDSAYGYQMGAVLFKPTLTTSPHTFRTTRAGALSYFVGGDPAFPDDSGFALKDWTNCEIDNAAILITGISVVVN